MLAILKWLGLLSIILVVTLFAVVNRDVVTLSMYPLPFEIALPLFLLIFVIFMLGFMTASLFGAIKRGRLKRSLRKDDKRIHALEEELTRLKHTPRS